MCWIYRNRRIAVVFGTGGLHRKLLSVSFTLVCVGLIKSYCTFKKNQFFLDFTIIGSLHRKHYGLSGVNIRSVLISSCLGYDFRYFYRISKCMKECVVQHNLTPAVWSALKMHKPYTWAMPDFHHCVNDSFVLLGSYAALFGSYRRLGATDRFHLQRFSSTALLLRVGPMVCPETSVVK